MHSTASFLSLAACAALGTLSSLANAENSVERALRSASAQQPIVIGHRGAAASCRSTR